MRFGSLVFCSLLLIACGPAEKGELEEGALPADGKDDGFASPADHGALAFASPTAASFIVGGQYHAWTFVLSGPADVVATTQAAGSTKPDTVLYLYKQQPTGSWGSYLGKNDDATKSTTWSSLKKSLAAGTYRVLVKGYTTHEKGRFAVNVACSGSGCAPAAPACLFGEQFHDIASSTTLRVTNHQKLTSPTGLAPLTEAQIIRALHASAHTDVTTIAEAFAAADQGEINFDHVWDQDGARSFITIEYGAGDNSYGAIFPDDSAAPVSLIHDGDLEQCTVKPETCLLGHAYIDVRESDAVTVDSSTVLKVTSNLTALQKSQVLAAVHESSSDAATISGAFGDVDGGEINLLEVTDRATGKHFTSYEFGAGDNSYGAIFGKGTTTRAVAIHDGDFYACAVFR